MTRVDVLVPAYNAAGTIDATLRSLQAQTLADIRIVVLDDGSTDSTHERVRQRAAGDARITMLRSSNRGIVDARNMLLEAARAPLVAWHDADDIALPHRLAAQAAHLDAHPDCVGVGGACWHIDAQGRRTGYRTRVGGTVHGNAAGLPAVEPWIGPFVMARTALLQRLGGYRHAHYAEDTDLYWRMAEHGTLYNLPDPVAEYRLHADSVSSASPHNGRISACNSQRGATLARRRAAGREDLGFPAEMQAAMRAAETFAAMVDIAGADLAADERRHFRIAAAAKLLELSSYRPYRLSAQDLRFVGATLMRHLRAQSPREAAMSFGWRLGYKSLRRGRARDIPVALDPRNLVRGG